MNKNHQFHEVFLQQFAEYNKSIKTDISQINTVKSPHIFSPTDSSIYTDRSTSDACFVPYHSSCVMDRP